MRRRRSTIIELTPLLDVVFILLFALMLNVNVSKARDEAEISELQETVDALNESAIEYEKLQAKLEEALLKSDESELALSEEVSIIEAKYEEIQTLFEQQELQLENKTDRLETIQEQLDDFEATEGIRLEDWLKYEQIGERYLFAEILVENGDGRVYINDDYTGVNLVTSDASISLKKKEKKDDLAGFIYDWLDHRQGGFTFVFVTVAVEDDVTRAVREIVFDTLSSMQPNFDDEQFLINNYVSYK